jgi:hypothetical protein
MEKKTAERLRRGRLASGATHGAAEEGGGSGRWSNPAVAEPGRWLKQKSEHVWGGGSGSVGRLIGCCFGLARKNSIYFDLFKNFSNSSKLIRFKDGLPLLKKIQVKYGCELFKIRNNFISRIFSRF